MSADRAREIADQLSALGESIADLAIDSLRGAMRSGKSGRPAAERQLTQARRAVEKAVHLLRTLDRVQEPSDEE
jgi:hypothetical protein